MDDLHRIVPEARVSDAPPDRILYGRDLWPRDLIRLRSHDIQRPGPAAVVWPGCQADVQRVVEYAKQTGTPLVPFGAGSGVCGAVAPSQRTIVMDLKRFADFEICPDGSSVEVGAGFLGITLENELQERGYTVGHFPSSILCSTVGGWVAARGAGQCSGRYGKIEDMVIATDVVLGSAQALRMDWRLGGPNLVPLMIGSEGTLGIVTRARLRLHALPAERVFSAFVFRTMQSGWQALREIYQSGLRPAVARLYDALDTNLAESKSGPGKSSSVLKAALRIPRAVNQVVRALEGNLLDHCQMILVFEGEADAARHDSSRAARVCRRHEGRSLGAAPARTWFDHRYAVSYRQSPVFRMGAFSDTMEVAAPWSKLSAVYEAVRRALGRHVVVLSHLSHVYPDGSSIYFTFSASARNDVRALELYDKLWPEALTAAIEAGGTLSHHHGVGRSKAPLMGRELGYGVEMMRRLKRAWDPAGVLNPGALIPEASARTATLGIESSPCKLDTESQLADLDATLSLDESANLLNRQGYSLRINRGGSETLAEWLEAGMPGRRNPWEDPVDHTLVGLTARLRCGKELGLAPVPRRAVGPDLSTLFVGDGRVGQIARVTLRVHPLKAEAARSLPGCVSSREPMTEAEASAWEAAVQAQLDA